MSRNPEQPSEYSPDDTSMVAKIARRQQELSSRENFYITVDEDSRDSKEIVEAKTERGYLNIGFKNGYFLQIKHNMFSDNDQIELLILSRGGRRVFLMNPKFKIFLIDDNITQLEVADYWQAAIDYVNEMDSSTSTFSLVTAKKVVKRGDVLLKKLKAGEIETEIISKRAQEIY